jgi:sensor histidine kinase regulating citrate/malate metabolism
MTVIQIIPQNPIYIILMAILILWSFAVLCFAIIITHEKSKRQYEAELSRNIIHSGSDYYKKMHEMSEQLRIMRHDYKYHLTSMQKMIDDGDTSQVKDYLAKVSDGIDDSVVHDYCNNRVLNALLYGYAERCKAADILFSAKIIPPPTEFDDYELCIITGNLLENAVTACQRTPLETKKYIELSMRPRESQYGIKVENSYDGVLRHEGKELFTTKKNGGLGINSIKAIAKRHNGEYVPVWDEHKFSAFVVLKIEE